MREILFRGKQRDNGEWVEGGIVQGVLHELWQNSDRAYITVFPQYLSKLKLVEVDPATVGQYTGLTDKNGKKIFEGDIFSIEDEIVAVVIFKDGCFRMEEYGLCGTWTESGFDECGGGWGVIQCDPIDWYTIIDMEVIGNVHDNPELLKNP